MGEGHMNKIVGWGVVSKLFSSFFRTTPIVAQPMHVVLGRGLGAPTREAYHPPPISYRTLAMAVSRSFAVSTLRSPRAT